MNGPARRESSPRVALRLPKFSADELQALDDYRRALRVLREARRKLRVTPAPATSHQASQLRQLISQGDLAVRRARTVLDESLLDE